MARDYVARFFDGRERYVAYGHDKDYLPVFHVRSGDHVATPMRYPSCLKFMPFATVRAMRRMRREDVHRLYGEQLPARVAQA